MKWFFTIMLLSFYQLATSGLQNTRILPQEDLNSRIQHVCDSVAIRAAKDIDSILLPGTVLIRVDDYPMPYGDVKRHYWYYLIKRGDTLFTHFK